MGHATVRGLIIPEIVKLISEKYSWSEEKALDEFYNSVTAECYADDELGLYGQSALHIFGLFVEERLSSNN